MANDVSVKLRRVVHTPHGTLGTIAVEDTMWYTLEREADDPKPAIPAGTYDLRFDFYHKGNYPAYEILNVPGRSRILIHAANTEDELLGCVAVGRSLGFLNNKLAVLESRKAFDQFMWRMGSRDGKITIIDPIIED